MKLKAVVPDNCPKILVEAFNAMRPQLMERVIGPHLHRPHFGPAEAYVQKCDEADGGTHGLFCEARLTGVSLADDRSIQDFRNARQALEDIYRELIEQYLYEGHEMQLFVSLMVDGKIGDSSLLEGTAIMVKGKRK